MPKPCDVYVLRLSESQVREALSAYTGKEVTRVFSDSDEICLGLALYVKGEPYQRHEWDRVREL